jgi:hypothetical protein
LRAVYWILIGRPPSCCSGYWLRYSLFFSISGQTCIKAQKNRVVLSTMSALGQKRTFSNVGAMPALPPIAEIRTGPLGVVALAASRCCCNPPRLIMREQFGLSLTVVISSRVRSCTPRIAVGPSFQREEVAEPPAHKRLGLVRGRSLTLRVSPSAE